MKKIINVSCTKLVFRGSVCTDRGWRRPIKRRVYAVKGLQTT